MFKKNAKQKNIKFNNFVKKKYLLKENVWSLWLLVIAVEKELMNLGHTFIQKYFI